MALKAILGVIRPKSTISYQKYTKYAIKLFETNECVISTNNGSIQNIIGIRQ